MVRRRRLPGSSGGTEMKFKHVQTLKSLRKAALIMMALCFMPVPIGILLGLPVKQRLAADAAPIVEEVRELTGASEIDVRTGAIGSAGYLSRINVRDYCVFLTAHVEDLSAKEDDEWRSILASGGPIEVDVTTAFHSPYNDSDAAYTWYLVYGYLEVAPVFVSVTDGHRTLSLTAEFRTSSTGSYRLAHAVPFAIWAAGRVALINLALLALIVFLSVRLSRQRGKIRLAAMRCYFARSNGSPDVADVYDSCAQSVALAEPEKHVTDFCALGERCWESVKAGRYIKDRGIRRPDAQPAKTQKAVI